MTLNYCEIVKSVFLDAGKGKNVYDYKIEIYKKCGFFYFNLFRHVLFDLKLNSANVMVSESFYIDETDKISILEEKNFTCVDECLHFALEQLEKHAQQKRKFTRKQEWRDSVLNKRFLVEN